MARHDECPERSSLSPSPSASLHTVDIHLCISLRSMDALPRTITDLKHIPLTMRGPGCNGALIVLLMLAAPTLLPVRNSHRVDHNYYFVALSIGPMQCYCYRWFPCTGRFDVYHRLSLFLAVIQLIPPCTLERYCSAGALCAPPSIQPQSFRLLSCRYVCQPRVHSQCSLHM
jgi:hypothetical protein